MKYYAVTEDPNELLHYGRLGMKWGKHIFGDKPKSSGYKRALGKLRDKAKTVKAAVQKSSTQHAINKQNRQQERYAKAVQKAQNRVNVIEGLNNLNKLQSYEKRAAQEFKAERNAERAALKQAKHYARNERKMQKYTQQAREGRLKYGKLSDDQVRQITERLAIERSARSLGNTEKPKFRRRIKEALQEGILQGVVQGTAAGMKEVAVAKVQNRLANKRVLDKESRIEAERQKEASRIKNKRTHKEVREDLRDEAYETSVKAGETAWDRRRRLRTRKTAEQLQRLKDAEDVRQWKIDQERKTLDSARQDRLNVERADKELEARARLAYEYGYLPSSGKQNGGNKDQQQKQKNNGKKQSNDGVDELSRYYKLRYVDKETLQQRAQREKKLIDETQKRLESDQRKREAEQKRRERQNAKAEKRVQETKQHVDAMIAWGARDQQSARSKYLNDQIKAYTEQLRKQGSDPYSRTGKVTETHVGSISGNYDPDNLFSFNDKNKYRRG